jgi:hypothetical protein
VGAWRKLQALAAQLQLQCVFDTANIADTHRQKRRLKAVIGEIFLDAPLLRQDEASADAVVGVEQPGLVDATRAQFGLHPPVELKTLRQEIQTTAHFTGFLVAPVEFSLSFHSRTVLRYGTTITGPVRRWL